MKVIDRQKNNRSESPLRDSLPVSKGGILVFLFALLFLFYSGSNMLFGSLSFAALAAYQLLIDRRLARRPSLSGYLMAAHIMVFLLLCTLVIWATTGPEESPYWIIYFLPIAVAADRLDLPRTLATCTAASLLYISLVPSPLLLDPELRQEDIPEILVFCITFFIVGLLVQTFSERHRRQLRDQQELNTRLLESQQTLKESLAKLEAAEESLRRQDRLAALGEMAAGIAHEIRNPLGIISSSAQLLDKTAAAGQGRSRQLLDIIQEETARLDNLISDFLSFGHPAPPDLRRVDVNTTLKRTLDHFHNLTQDRGMSVSADLPGFPLPALIDPDLIQQVLLNLLLNAMEASEAGGRIEVALKRSGNNLKISVRDHGAGIPEEYLTKIFNPFFTTKDRGIGLGLSNAYKIVESHGGELLVRSVPGEGATFTVLLPMEN